MVALDDNLPMIMCRLYFVEVQGYTVDQKIMFQDSQLTMRLVISGFMSSSAFGKHIKARYYLQRIRLRRVRLIFSIDPPRKCGVCVGRPRSFKQLAAA